ncbi:hypothetical protein RHSIM_Rhsim07G0147900 [Rhododendron simsii]|uniref:Uncharacterized protein n=1 Tax=Rhododendron simsii TaxID=118357 RepID=A0A834GKG3_RHOSS|nr:hypothetical protein RHSIM_Rhsim07G0147900 [Rhododendron simsii]
MTATSVGKEIHRVDYDHPKESSSLPPDTHLIREELSDSEDELLEVLEGVVSSNQEERVLNQSIKTATSLAKVHSELKSSLANEPPNRLDPGVSKVAIDMVSKGSAGFNKFLSKSTKKRLKKQAKEETLSAAISTISGGVAVKGLVWTITNAGLFSQFKARLRIRPVIPGPKMVYPNAANKAAIMLFVVCKSAFTAD